LITYVVPKLSAYDINACVGLSVTHDHSTAYSHELRANSR